MHISNDDSVGPELEALPVYRAVGGPPKYEGEGAENREPPPSHESVLEQQEYLRNHG